MLASRKLLSMCKTSCGPNQSVACSQMSRSSTSKRMRPAVADEDDVDEFVRCLPSSVRRQHCRTRSPTCVRATRARRPVSCAGEPKERADPDERQGAKDKGLGRGGRRGARIRVRRAACRLNPDSHAAARATQVEQFQCEVKGLVKGGIAFATMPNGEGYYQIRARAAPSAPAVTHLRLRSLRALAARRISCARQSMRRCRAS